MNLEQNYKRNKYNTNSKRQINQISSRMQKVRRIFGGVIIKKNSIDHETQIISNHERQRG